MIIKRALESHKAWNEKGADFVKQNPHLFTNGVVNFFINSLELRVFDQ